MLNFSDFIQVYVFTTNHHLKQIKSKVNGYMSVKTTASFTFAFLSCDQLLKGKNLLPLTVVYLETR